MPLLRPQAIEDITISVWDMAGNAQIRRLMGMPLPERIDRLRADVAAGQNRFRMGYAACVVLGEEEAKATCPHVKEAHFHGRVRRIGHLPMFTIKELPE